MQIRDITDEAENSHLIQPFGHGDHLIDDPEIRTMPSIEVDWGAVGEQEVDSRSSPSRNQLQPLIDRSSPPTHRNDPLRREPSQPPKARRIEAPAHQLDFRPLSVLMETWRHLHGAKTIFWTALLRVFFVFMGVAFVCNSVAVYFIEHTWKTSSVLSYASLFFLETAIDLALLAGILELCIDLTEGDNPDSGKVFSPMSYLLEYGLLGLLMAVAVGLGTILLILPGLLLILSYGFAPLVLWRHSPNPWKAMEISRRAAFQAGPRFFGAGLAVLGIVLATFLPFVLIRGFLRINEVWVYSLLLPVFWGVPFGFFFVANSFKELVVPRLEE